MGLAMPLGLGTMDLMVLGTMNLLFSPFSAWVFGTECVELCTSTIGPGLHLPGRCGSKSESL